MIRYSAGRILVIAALAAILSSCSTTTTVHLRSTPTGASVTELSRPGRDSSWLGRAFCRDANRRAGAGYLGETDTSVTLPSRSGLGRFFCGKGLPRVFVFQLRGWEQETVRKAIRGGEVTLHALLARLATSLEVVTSPSDATVQVILDGRQIDGWVGTDLDALFGGRESVRLTFDISAPGYERLVVDREIRRASENRLAFSLKAASYGVAIRSEPRGVDVYEEQLGYLGRTPLEKNLSAQEVERISDRRDQRERREVQLKLVFQKEGYQRVERVEIIHLDEATNEIKIVLEAEE